MPRSVIPGCKYRLCMASPVPIMLQDDLIEKLGGVDKVAEMSGRKRRMVKQSDGKYKYLSRSGPHTPLDGVSFHQAQHHPVLAA